MGKGSLWRVEPLQRQNLIQALTRSPFFPSSTVDKITTKNSNAADIGAGFNVHDEEDSAPSNSHVGSCEDEIVVTKPIISSSSVSGNSTSTNINARFDPRLFPNLSKAFSDMEDHNVLNDVPDHESPSDYSTNNNQQRQQHLAQLQNTNDSYQLTLNTTNNNQHKKSHKIQQNGCSNDETATGVAAAGGTSAVAPVLLINNFSSYESIEHLTRDCGADSMDDVNAATAMLALKHGPKIFSETFHSSAPVITSSPSEDHTYSAGGSSNAGSGASTPLMLTNNSMATPLSISINGNGSNREQQQQQQQLINGCDNQSNGASSEDAAYESSDEM